MVQGNSIGTDVNGTVALGNDHGVCPRRQQQPDRRTGEDQGNLVSGNDFSGVTLKDSGGDPSEDNDVQGNLIGTTTPAPRRFPNSTGVRIVANADNTIGGTPPAPATSSRATSGRRQDPVRGADDNDVQGNWIGTDEAETVDLGNGGSGVEILDGAENRIGATLLQNPSNVIANNGGDGVTVTSGVGNAIVRNSMYDNVLLGIDLNADGTNGERQRRRRRRHRPERSRTARRSTRWSDVDCAETEPADYRLEFFASDSCDPRERRGPDVPRPRSTCPPTPTATRTPTAVTVTAGQFVTMTATRLVGAEPRGALSTSEFSPCEEVQ